MLFDIARFKDPEYFDKISYGKHLTGDEAEVVNLGNQVNLEFRHRSWPKHLDPQNA